MCCKLLGVEELYKMPGEWCDYCEKGVRCKIYDNRPSTCSEYECLWLQNPNIPDNLRPDKSRVVLSSTVDGEGIVAHVDVGHYPQVVKEGVVGKFLKRMVNNGITVIATCGEERMVLYSSTHVRPELRELLLKNVAEGGLTPAKLKDVG
jgi:uncharacterized protein